MTDLEERVQRLEDIAAIQQLKLAYADCISSGLSGEGEFPRERFKNLFLPDAIWEANHYGQIEGNDAITDFYAKVGPKVSFVLQYQIGHTVEVAPSGTEATGQCYVWEPSSMAGRAIFSAGTYEERYRKVSDQWLFERVSVYIHFMTPYEDGWVKKPWPTRADFQ